MMWRPIVVRWGKLPWWAFLGVGSKVGPGRHLRQTPWDACDDGLSDLPSAPVFARTNGNDRRAAWLNQFR